MSTDPEAKLFYGYLQPKSDKEAYEEMYADEDTPWSAIHGKEIHGCVGDIHGYDEHLGFFLAVKESLHTAEWDEVHSLTQQDFEVKPTWYEALYQAAKEWNLDLTGLQPGWYLVCLYF